MLPVARGMVDFDLPDDCKARNATIDTLVSLKAEAESKLGVAAPPKPSAGPSAAPLAATPAPLLAD